MAGLFLRLGYVHCFFEVVTRGNGCVPDLFDSASEIWAWLAAFFLGFLQPAPADADTASSRSRGLISFGRPARLRLPFAMNIMAIGGKFPRWFTRRSTARSAGLSLLFLLAFAMAGCGPSSDNSNANLSTSSVTPAPSVAPRPVVRPQVELAAAFDASTETILDLKSPGDLTRLKALRQVNLSAAANGLNITASGDDPSLLLPPFCEGKQSILQVVIDTPVDTPVQLFYAFRDHPGFNEAQSQTLALKKGRNVVYFQLDQGNLVDPLRLDPGASPGEYVIESVIARSMTKPPAP